MPPDRALGIGILSSRFPPAYYGGAELQAAGLAGRLAARHRVHVFTRDGGEALADLWSRSGVRIHSRPSYPFPLRPAADLASGLESLRRFRSEIDVLLAYQAYIDGLMGALARRFLGLPLAIWIRGEEEVRPELSLKSRLLSARILAASDCVIAQSPRLRILAESLLPPAPGADRFRTIPNGVDPADPGEEERHGILFVGRLVSRKGVEFLLDAVERLGGAPLTIVGDGPKRRGLERRARGLPVRFLGSLPPEEVRRRLKEAMILVLPAVQGEGVPNVLLEAMACGTPVVATDGGGVPDLVEDGRTGLLVPPRDAPRLAEALGRLLEDADLRARLSAGGRGVAADHDWDRVTRSVEETLLSIAAGSGGSSS